MREHHPRWKLQVGSHINGSTAPLLVMWPLAWKNPLQYSHLENPMDGGAWWAAVHGVASSWTQLSDFTFTFHCHALEKEMATHCSVLAWRIPRTGEPDGLLSMGSHRVGHDWSDLAAAAAAAWKKAKHWACSECPARKRGSIRKSPVDLIIQGLASLVWAFSPFFSYNIGTFPNIFT